MFIGMTDSLKYPPGRIWLIN